MKCYKMHNFMGDRIVGFLHMQIDAVTIYQGYAVCQEHLEELERSQFTPTGEPYIIPDIEGVFCPTDRIIISDSGGP